MSARSYPNRHRSGAARALQILTGAVRSCSPTVWVRCGLHLPHHFVPSSSAFAFCPAVQRSTLNFWATPPPFLAFSSCDERDKGPPTGARAMGRDFPTIPSTFMHSAAGHGGWGFWQTFPTPAYLPQTGPGGEGAGQTPTMGEAALLAPMSQTITYQAGLEGGHRTT